MEELFGLLFLAMIVASIWGGVNLARRCFKDTLTRICFALVVIPVFIAAGTCAVIAGCAAVNGPPNFH